MHRTWPDNKIKMSGLQQMYDLKDPEQAKEYLEKVGIEYSFQVK